MGDFLLSEEHRETLKYLLTTFKDAKEYGSILDVEKRDYDGFLKAWELTAEATAENIVMLLWYSECNQIVPILAKQAKILSQQYDVVVTNPPYMGISNGNTKLNTFVKKNYPDSKSDLFAVFIECCGQMIKENGYQAMITQHAWMFLSSFEKLRVKLQMVDTVNMAHLGARAFEEIGGEVVQTTSFIIRKSCIGGYKGTYCRLIEPTTQQGKEKMFLAGENRYVVLHDNFMKIPGSPVAYWVSEKVLKNYKIGKLMGEIALPCAGLATGDNNVFQRIWYEVSYDNIGFGIKDCSETLNRKEKWYPCNSGGEYRKWSTDDIMIVNWGNDGEEIRKFRNKSGKIASRPQNTQRYFKRGLTWNKLSTSHFAVKYKEEGYVFDDTSRSAFPLEETELFYLIGVLCSCVSTHYLEALNPTMSFTNGDIIRIPVCFCYDRRREYINEIVKNNIILSRNDWNSFETSWDFTQHPLIDCASFSKKKMEDDKKKYIKDMNYIEEAYKKWENECFLRFNQLKSNEEELNRIFIDIYGLQEELIPEVEDKDVTVRKADLQRDIKSLISYAVGCIFGRYSLDMEGLVYAGGEWESSKYQTYIPDADNCILITDEEYFEDDIVGRFVEFVKVVYGKDTLEENLDFIAKALDVKGNTSREVIKNYFLNSFIKDHIKIYQKRPIYWLFDSGKQNGFKALIYMHRYNADTIGNLRIDYLHRMERIYESEINRMQDTIDNSSNAREVTAASKRKEKLQKQLKECKEYDEKIGHLALSRIEIDLDDGVKVNYEKVQTANDGKKYQVLAKI